MASSSSSSSSYSSAHPNDGKSLYGGRDVVGYAANPPDPKWPNGAKVSEKTQLQGNNNVEKTWAWRGAFARVSCLVVAVFLRFVS